MLNQANACAIYMQRELGFELADVWGLKFVRPFVLWPHVEVHTRDGEPEVARDAEGVAVQEVQPG
jgi:hypothetical protein